MIMVRLFLTAQREAVYIVGKLRNKRILASSGNAE